MARQNAQTRGRIRDIANDRYSDWHGVTEVVRYAAAGITVPGTLTVAGTFALQGSTIAVGVAGATTGKITLAGATSGVVTITVNAAAGTYSLELPADDGCCGEQLTTSGAGVLTWAAASKGEFKNIGEEVCQRAALKTVLSTKVHEYTYKPTSETNHWDNGGGPMTGIIAEEAPWAMQGRKLGAFSPINSFGMLLSAFKELAGQVKELTDANARALTYCG